MMPKRFSTMMAALCFFLGACTPIQFSPVIDGVVPNWGYNGESTAISVQGEALFPGMAANGSSISGYDRDFSITLRGSEVRRLSGVKHAGSGQVDGIVPPGLTPGWYGLELETPSGETAYLDEAFEVTSSRADRIQVEVSPSVVPVSGLAIVRLAVLDPDDDIVPEPVFIELSMRPTHSDGSSFSIVGGDLVDQQGGEDGASVSGYLGLTGEGFVGVSSRLPDDVWIEVSAAVRDRYTVTARELVRFEAGATSSVIVDLPVFTEHPSAGSPFDVTLHLVDSGGHPVKDEPAALAITEGCPGGTLSQSVTFVETAVVTVAPTRACEGNQIRVFGIVEGKQVSGLSEPFTVDPGPTTNLLVTATPERIQAGLDLLNIFVQGLDEYGNPTHLELGELSLSDGENVLSDLNGNGTFSCSSVGMGAAQCTARLYVASPGSVIEATTESGIRGLSAPIQVAPGSGASLDVDVTELSTTAGDAVEVVLRAEDQFGNPIILSSDERDELSFADSEGPVDCESSGVDLELREYVFDCTFVTAGEDQILSVSSASLGIVGNSGSFRVRPGGLQRLEITLDASDIADGVDAGNSITVALEGTDDWGNRVDGTHALNIANVGGGALPLATTLSDGVGLVSLTLTRSIPGDSVWFFYDGRMVGGTSSFDVWPGPAVAVDLVLERPWAFVGEPFRIDWYAKDSYGNPTAIVDDAVRAVSRGGLAADFTGTTSGAGPIELMYDFPGLGDTIDVTVGPFTQSLEMIDVVRDCELLTDGSVLAVGRPDGRICLPGEGTARVPLAWSLSEFQHANLTVDGEPFYRGAEEGADMDVMGSGRFLVEGLLVDAMDCGVESTLRLYAGPEDGAVGPVMVLSGADSLTSATEGPAGSTGVAFSALQCSGDAAVDTELLIRVDKGELASMDSLVESEGSGLRVELDSFGEGSVEWTMAGEDSESEAALFVGTVNQAAFGRYEIDVRGDSRPPYVTGMSPAGAIGGSVDRLEIFFSEPMLELGSIEDEITILSPIGSPAFTASFGEADDTLIVDMSVPIDADTLMWDVELSDSFRDLSGNRLDGDLDGEAGGAWVGMIGPTGAEAPAVIQCGLSTGWFKPDGDDGSGVESDVVWIDLEASSPADWWRLDVVDLNGTLRARTFWPMIRPFGETIPFDGTDHEGRTLDAGHYGLSVSAVDGDSNIGSECVSTVVIVHTLKED